MSSHAGFGPADVELPIIAVTASIGPGFAEKCLDIGMNSDVATRNASS